MTTKRGARSMRHAVEKYLETADREDRGFLRELGGTATGGRGPLFGCVLRPPLVRKGKKGPDSGFSV
jgi:hypothetical protein